MSKFGEAVMPQYALNNLKDVVMFWTRQDSKLIETSSVNFWATVVMNIASFLLTAFIPGSFGAAITSLIINVLFGAFWLYFFCWLDDTKHDCCTTYCCVIQCIFLIFLVLNIATVFIAIAVNFLFLFAGLLYIVLAYFGVCMAVAAYRFWKEASANKSGAPPAAAATADKAAPATATEEAAAQDKV